MSTGGHRHVAISGSNGAVTTTTRAIRDMVSPKPQQLRAGSYHSPTSPILSSLSSSSSRRSNQEGYNIGTLADNFTIDEQQLTFMF
jgi:phosphoribulokinase